MNTKHLGVVTILLASIMWAIEPILAKLSYENSDFLHTSAIRAIVAALTAFIYIVLTRKSPLKVTRQQLSPLIYIAIVGTLVADFMYFFALSQVPVINAVIIGHMQPIFIIAFGFFLLKSDTLTKFDYLGICLDDHLRITRHNQNPGKPVRIAGSEPLEISSFCLQPSPGRPRQS